MSDIAKWGLLVAGALVLIGLIVALPFVEFINVPQFVNSLEVISAYCGNAFRNARGLINNFLTPFGRSLLSGIMIYLFGKWAINIGIKITAWVYHFIFK